MKKIVKIALVLMMSIWTAISTGLLLVYATSSNGNFYFSGKYYFATLYEGDPGNGWYDPKDLGIIQIIEKNATSLAVSIPTSLNPGDLEVKRPIFKYKDRFYQIQHAELHWDAFPESAKGVLIPMFLSVPGWLLTGLLLLRGRKKKE